MSCIKQNSANTLTAKAVSIEQKVNNDFVNPHNLSLPATQCVAGSGRDSQISNPDPASFAGGQDQQINKPVPARLSGGRAELVEASTTHPSSMRFHRFRLFTEKSDDLFGEFDPDISLRFNGGGADMGRQ